MQEKQMKRIRFSHPSRARLEKWGHPHEFRMSTVKKKEWRNKNGI